LFDPICEARFDVATLFA